MTLADDRIGSRRRRIVHKPDRRAIRRWLSIWKSVGGVAVLSYRHPPTKGLRTLVLVLDDLDTATDKVAELARDGDVYLRATTLKEPPPRGRRGGAKDTRALHGVWCDLDHAQGCHADRSGGLPLPPTPEEALAVVDGLPEPSMVINTSGGYQAWWFFDEPMEIGSHSYEELQETVASWSEMIVQRGAALNFHVDAVQDLARLMRVPGTLNHKWSDPKWGGDGKVAPRPVTISSESGIRYSVEELRDLAPSPVSAGSAPNTPLRRSDRGAIDRWAENTTWGEVVEPHGWTKLQEYEDGHAEWTRPGNPSSERSAVTDFEGVPVMVVFSENAGLPVGAGHKLTKFRVYAHLNFGGDEAAAAQAIREEFGGGMVEDATSAGRSSWQPVDPSEFLDGDYTPPTGSQLSREDGLNLLYPGTVNGLHGESESAKSWIAQFACVQALWRGEAVVYIDFDEPTKDAVLFRMQLLGISRDALEDRFLYVQPDESFEGDHVHLFEALLQDSNPGLVVLDGVTDGMAIHGLNPLEAADFAKFDRLLPRWIALRGPAVLLIDHVAQGRPDAKYAFGSQHKRAAIGGASYRVKVSKTFAPDGHGVAKLEIAKDRHGTIRGAAEKVAAEFHLDASGAGSPIAELRVPGSSADRSNDFRDTAMMEKVSRFIEDAREPLTVRAIQDGLGGGKTSVNEARERLIEEGYVEVESGSHGSKLHHSVQPFRVSDEASVDRPCAPDRPEQCSQEQGQQVDPVASPRPPVPTGTGTGTRSGSREEQRGRKPRKIIRRASPLKT